MNQFAGPVHDAIAFYATSKVGGDNYQLYTDVFVEDVFSFNVIEGGKELGEYMGREPGFIRPNFKWNTTVAS